MLRVCELFGETICNMFWCGCYFVVECYGNIVWMEVLCWIYRVLSSNECAYCACDPSVHLSIPPIGFVYVFCMLEVISSFKIWRTGSQVSSLLMLFLCVIFHTMCL